MRLSALAEHWFSGIVSTSKLTDTNAHAFSITKGHSIQPLALLLEYSLEGRARAVNTKQASPIHAQWRRRLWQVSPSVSRFPSVTRQRNQEELVCDERPTFFPSALRQDRVPPVPERVAISAPAAGLDFFGAAFKKEDSKRRKKKCVCVEHGGYFPQPLCIPPFLPAAGAVARSKGLLKMSWQSSRVTPQMRPPPLTQRRK